MRHPYISVMGYNVYSAELEGIDIPVNRTVINTINAYSYVLARNDEVFRKALGSSDILIADGFPVVIAARLLKRIKIRKIAGNDLFIHTLGQLNQSSGSCFFLGSSEETLKSIGQKLNDEYPNIRAEFFSPPFKAEFSKEDNLTMIGRINAFSPDVLFVGMTAPKQECWVYENNPELTASLICSIGAVFDFYAGTVKRPSNFWIHLKLEWFIRFIKEPRRLWRRYFICSPRFFKYMLLDLLKRENRKA